MATQNRKFTPVTLIFPLLYLINFPQKLPMTHKPTCLRKSNIIKTTKSSLMKLFLITFLIHFFFIHGHSKSEIHAGYPVTVEVPAEYSAGFIGRAFVMETNQMVPNFKCALSVEALNGKYSCSLEVFHGDLKVWNSGHFSPFYTSDKCVLVLSDDGDLQLKGPNEHVGWHTGTAGLGVERLQLLMTGNLVLIDALNNIKWQSFNFPTDVMLWSQRLNVTTNLTSFTTNSTLFYSFEIQHNKIALYLNSGKWKYSYWEFKPPKPSKHRNISFIELGSKGLELFNDKHKKIAQIPSQRLQRLRFLALGNQTGNLGLYHYSPNKGIFEASFKALNTTCDLPLACKPFGICTFSNSCSCIWYLTSKKERSPDCGEGISQGFCDGRRAGVEMIELEGVSSVLRNEAKKSNVSKEECKNLCMVDCKCVAALHSSGKSGTDMEECFLYGLVRGVKEVEKGSGFSYLIKVPKGTGKNHGKTNNVRQWVLVLVGVIDGLILFAVVAGLGYYVIQRRRKILSGTAHNTT